MSLFVLALRDLARAGKALPDLRRDAASAAALAQFVNSIPDFNEIRIVIEHFDEHASGKLKNKALQPSLSGAKLVGLVVVATATVTDRVSAGDCTIHLTEEDAAGGVIGRWSLPVGQAVGAGAALVGALTPPVP